MIRTCHVLALRPQPRHPEPVDDDHALRFWQARRSLIRSADNVQGPRGRTRHARMCFISSYRLFSSNLFSCCPSTCCPCPFCLCPFCPSTCCPCSSCPFSFHRR